jgi:hypothetical protein
VISYSGQLDFILELRVPQDFSRDCVFPWILDNDLLITVRVLFQGDHPGRETFLEFLLVFLRYRLSDDDVW